MAIRKKEYGQDNIKVYKLPEFPQKSKMNKYDLFFDPKTENKPRAGFFKSIYFSDEQKNNMITFVVTGEYEHRIDLISFKFFGTTENDWLIEIINEIKDPIKDVISGKILYIPSEIDIYSILG